MPALATCPNVQMLEQLASGSLADDLVEPLLDHLEGCSACATKIQGMSNADTLIETMRRLPSVDDSEEDGSIARRIIDQLTRLPAEAAPGTIVGLGQQPCEHTPTLDTPVRSSPVPANVWDFLAPPEQPDE